MMQVSNIRPANDLDLLTLREVSLMFGIPEAGIRRIHQRRGLAAIRLNGLKFRRQAVIDWLERQEKAPVEGK